MKTRTTITLTFTLEHTADTDIDRVRQFRNRCSEYTEGSDKIFEREDDGGYVYRKADGSYGREFTFKTLDDYIAKYSKKESGTLAKVFCDYGSFVSVTAKSEEVKDDDE